MGAWKERGRGKVYAENVFVLPVIRFIVSKPPAAMRFARTIKEDGKDDLSARHNPSIDPLPIEWNARVRLEAPGEKQRRQSQLPSTCPC